MADFYFDPNVLTVHVGERVHLELRSQGSFPHNFAIGELGAGSSPPFFRSTAKLTI